MRTKAAQFLADVGESINDKGILKAIFMAGSPGAGKSYTISQVGRGGYGSPRIGFTTGVRIINVDVWYEYYVEYGSTRVGKLPKSVLYMDRDKLEDELRRRDNAIKTQMDTQLRLYINSMLPLFVDGTSVDPAKIFYRDDLLHQCGYDTGMIFVRCNLESALWKNKKRGEEGGRKLEDDLVTNMWQMSEDTYDDYSGHFDWFQTINNNPGELTDEVILEAFRECESFFDSPVENSIGIQIIQELQETGGKYLDDLQSPPPYELLISQWRPH